MEQYVFVPINLNTASEETLLSFPGATSQLLRALKNPRPYKNIEQFRRELAKSVSAREVVRIERYFTINRESKIQSIIIRASTCRIDHTTATLRLISQLFSSLYKSAKESESFAALVFQARRPATAGERG